MMSRDPQEWEPFLGEQVRRLRLQKNMTQDELASRAGVSKSALISLELGKGSTLRTFLSILDVFDKSNWIRSLAPEVSISPVQMFEFQGNQRQRASKSNRK